MSDIDLSLAVLTAKEPVYTKLINYADGIQPLVYATEALRSYFNKLNVHYVQNWMEVVINSVADRLHFKGWAVTGTDTGKLDLTYAKQKLTLESEDVHWATLVTGEGYLIVWGNDDDQQIYYNDPRMCHLFYDPANPKQKRMACKMYRTADDHFELILYYPTETIFYRTKDSYKTGNRPKSEKEFERGDTVPNPYGEIPVFHFQLHRKSKKSEISSVISLQDAVNKLFADMMVSSEYGAVAQRWVITNADTTMLKNAPNEIWRVPNEPGTAIGQFDSQNLKIFLEAIDSIAQSIGIITRTPKHYFFAAGASVSGETLIAMEAPLIAKVEHYQSTFGIVWEEVGIFLLKLKGIPIDEQKIEPTWEQAESVQPLTEAQTLKTNVDAQVPLITALRWAGKDQTEIDTVLKELAEQKNETANLTALLLDKMRREREQENRVGYGDESDQETTEDA